MIEQLLKKELIFNDVKVPGHTKEEALKIIASLCKDFTNIDSQKLYEAFMERENLDSTGFGEGFAIPHAKINHLNEALIMIVRFDDAIEWEAIDDEPVNVAIALVMPNGDKDNLHVQVLSKLARKLMNEAFTHTLRHEKNIDVLYKYILETMED